jgi:hypothetical protein
VCGCNERCCSALGAPRIHLIKVSDLGVTKVKIQRIWLSLDYVKHSLSCTAQIQPPLPWAGSDNSSPVRIPPSLVSGNWAAQSGHGPHHQLWTTRAYRNQGPIVVYLVSISTIICMAGPVRRPCRWMQCYSGGSGRTICEFDTLSLVWLVPTMTSMCPTDLGCSTGLWKALLQRWTMTSIAMHIDKPYYLDDGIYPDRVKLVKTIRNPQTENR